MELRHIKYFLTASHEKSINRAAKELRVSQPAVSRQIRDLENELGVKLFERDSRGLTLTKEGEMAVVFAEDLLCRVTTMKAALNPHNPNLSKRIRLGYIAPVIGGFMVKAMREFKHQFADIALEIQEMSPVEQEIALRNKEIDLALLGNPSPCVKKYFSYQTILKVPLSLVLPDNHLLALRKSIELSELAGESFVSLDEKHFSQRPKLLAEISKVAKFQFKVGIKAEGISDLLAQVAGGGGVAILPDDVKTMPHSGVVFIKMSKPRIFLESAVAWRGDNQREEISYLVETLKKAGKTYQP